MHNSKLKKISVALCIALLPVSVFAAGLGKLNIDSGIGEPLKANIELLSVSASELATLKAVLATKETYAAQGLERPASHNGIKVSIVKNSRGVPSLRLRSNQAIAEPFLDMLIKLDWATGSLLREYTVLLDPPGYKPQVVTNKAQAPTVKVTDKMPAKKVADKASSKKTTSTKKNNKENTSQVRKRHPLEYTPGKEKSTPSAAAYVAGEDHLTQKGDTLSKVAAEMKPAGVSLDQMLVGLYQANPDAFIDNNMNRLKVGKILQPPSEEALNAMTRKEASSEVKVQAANWNEYSNKLAGMVEDSALPDFVALDTETQAASGKITSAEDQSIPAATGPKDIVKLSTGNAESSSEAKDLQAKVEALQEEIVAREKGLQEAQEKTTALELQIADMQKLLTLQNNKMADAQQSAETTPAEAVAETTPTPAEPEQAKPVEVAKPKATPKPKPVKKPVAQPPAKEPGLIGGLDPIILGAGGLLLALLAGGWFYLRNKRKKSLADFEQGIMTSGGLKANTVFGNTSGASVDTGDTSFLTDFSQSTSGGMIDTNDVDPIAEAEVYMAYGRDAQAEEILKDAITKEPKRHELHLKLLEMYAASKDMSAFETVSGELYTTLGADDPTWAKVAEIGIKLEPNNPLYHIKPGEVASASVGEAVTAEPVAAAEEPAGDTSGELDASDFSDSPLAAEADLDFSLGDGEVGSAAPVEAEKPDEVKGVDLSVDESKLDVPEVSELLKTEDTALNFDMDTSSSSEDELGGLTSLQESATFEQTMPSLDLPSAEAESSAAPVVDVMGALPELEIPEDLTLDMPALNEVEDASPAEITLDAPTLGGDTPAESLELSADAITLDIGESASGVENVEVPTLDLSGTSLDADGDSSISLEMTDEAAPTLDTPSETADLAVDEPAEVETKLELVAAYMDMEDKEGAKELLDEVIKEGGADQRKRAEALLTKLS